MDLAVRERLLAAESRRDAEALENAYELIKSASQGKSVLDSSDNFSTDLYVLCAEQAIQLGYLEMSSDCLQMYFKGKFTMNQFLGRAYLCQGQLHTPLSTDNLEEFEKFVMFFMKAIDFAISDQRYYFLIYNASVLYWQLVRPYLKPGFRYCLIPSLSQIVKALNQTEEQDSEWRAELMINLLECFLDASKLKDAEEFLLTAATFIKENVPDKYSRLFSLMVYHKLIDISQVEKEIEHSIHFSVIYKMQTLKSQWDTNEFPSDAAENLNSLYVLLKQYEVPPASVLTLKIPLILELARFCMKVNYKKLAYDCILDLKRAEITEKGKLIEIQCLESEYEIQKMDTTIRTYTRGVVEAQLEVIKNLELTLKRAVQLGDPGVIQVVCTTQWNLCLPLLQHNLRQHVRTPLIAVADVLEGIDSMMILFRCQVHMEIARIEEDGDRMEAAMEHVQKAMHLDKKGQHQEYLRLTFNRLRLCTALRNTPERPEDQAAVMIEQAKKGEQKGNMRKWRSLLVNAGRALAPDSFHIVLDSENEAKVSSDKSMSQISYLCAKAQHHVKSMEKADEHLKHFGGENYRERVKLWADLAKAARKGEVWDVCRAACRFCLLYEESLFRKVSKPPETQNKKPITAMMDDDQGDSLPGESVLSAKSFSFESSLLRILAEIRFLNAEATVHLLRLQGVELNDYAVPPQGASSYLPENDPEWKTYSSWIDCLSQYAMENFQRAAEIGEELNEAWIVHSAVVYVLNYNRHLISSGRQRQIIEYLQTLLGAVRTVGHDGSATILLMLCDALARGLMLRWIPKPTFSDKENKDAATGRSEKAAAKKHDKANVSLSFSVDPSGVPDTKTALEICEFALSVAAGAMPSEAIPVATQQQIIATWVKAKQLNQQQIRHKLWTEEESNEEAQNLTERILVGLEMHSCNGLGFMDFAVPSLSQLVKLALECSWSDSLVELQVLTRLMYFAYESHDYEIVMACSKRILQIDENFLHSRDAEKHEMLQSTERQELLSIAACIQGKSIMENSSGRKHVRVAASEAFVQSARFAGKAGSYPLVMFAAKHFWNTCLPLLVSPQDRQQFKKPAEIILKNIIKVESENKQDRKELLPLHQWITKDFQSIGLSAGCFLPGAEEDLTLRTSLYGLLFHIHADEAEWETALKVLDEAVWILPQTRHRLLIFKHRATAKARLGCNFMVDMEKLREESEDRLSQMWRHLVTVSSSTVGQLNCFQNAITTLQKQENDWQKVDYLLEFAQWLYYSQFPLSDVIKPLDWVVDLLLHVKLPTLFSQEERRTVPQFLPTEHLKVDTGSDDAMAQMTLEDLSNIKQLEALFRVQTLVAFISGHSSPHQQHCMMAYACILRIWQVSLSAAGSVAKVLSQSSQVTAPQKAQSINAPKKEDKRKEQQAEESVVTEKPKGTGSADTLPASVEEWAHYDCPREIRDAFRRETNSYGINRDNFPNPIRTLYFMDLFSKELQKIFCPHLILPVFQLAEVIANEVVGSRSLSDLYHLRIALICADLNLSQASLYHEKAAGEAHISELEQAMCRHEIALTKEKVAHTEKEDGKTVSDNAQVFDFNTVAGKGPSALSFLYLWIEKAEVLIQLGLYQQARHLLSEAHSAAQELGALRDVSRCLYLLAVLASLERNHKQAKALLEKAQLLGGNEEFWYNSTLGLIEAVLEGEGEGRQSMACEILEHTVDVLRSALVKRPNRQSELGFIIASLEARKTIIQIHSMIVNAEPCQLPHMLQESCNKLVQSQKDFFHHGHKNCSAEILLECANVHRMIAKQERNKEEKRNHYLDAFNLAQRAVSETEEVFHDVWSLFAVQTANVSTPLMRQLANRKINLVEIALDIFHLVITEKKLKQKGKASSHELMEAFIRGTAEDDATEQDWERMEYTVGHTALAQLANLQHLCRGCPHIKSKCLYLTGKTLRLLAINVDPVHSELYWEPDVMEEANSNTSKSSLAPAECSEQEVTDSNLPTDKNQYDKCMRKVLELKKEHGLSQKYLSQSSEALLQSIGIAFSHNVTDVLAPASLEMVECFQQFDPVSSSQFLALHQSCSASLTMKSILLTATSNTSSSQLAALLHLQNHLQQHRNTSDLLKKVEQQLAATSMAWKNLCVPVEHFNIVDELPPNFCVIILQHSEDRSNVYRSLIERSKVNTAEQKGRPTQPTVQAKVSRCPVNPGTYSILMEKLHLYKQQQQQQSDNFKQTVIQNLKDCVSKKDEIPPVKADGNGHDVTSDFSEILEMMEEYLEPVLSQCDLSGVGEASASGSAAESGTIKVKDKDTKHTRKQGTPPDMGLCVVLLGDRLFMELPLEALSIFKGKGISSVCRDFSLLILYNRIHLAESEIEVKAGAEISKKTSPKAHQKKNAKKASVNRDLPSNCLSVDARNFKYIVDPYNEGRNAEALSPSQKMKEILEKHRSPFTLQWEGVTGSDCVPSQAEWEQLLTNCSAFLFFGMERFLSHVLLDSLVAMNIPKCRLMILLDLVRSKESYQRTANSGIHKNYLHVAVEEPTETAMLLSLTGVGSIIANQWFTTLQENAERLDILSESLLSMGRTTGQTVRVLQETMTAKGRDSITMQVGSHSSPGCKAEDETIHHCSDLPETPPSSLNCVLYGLPNSVLM
ncbi:cilia- and flagella-associated protein 46 [Pogoniulus pusillus]|uniref:cilia- and flagella-associated protein 46 n=1 Tax=Pogoniulus pusillus TaxID=488313 RepID=UPI0030B99737